MLRGELIGLRAQQDSDIEVFETELLNDVDTRMRSDSRPWRPVAPGSADSPYRGPADRDDHGEVVKFSAVELATGELAGEALLWAIDVHNRSAHIGLSLRPAFRGKHLGTDIVSVLCRYGFAIRGLHRLQVRGHHTSTGLGQRKVRGRGHPGPAGERMAASRSVLRPLINSRSFWFAMSRAVQSVKPPSPISRGWPPRYAFTLKHRSR